MMNSNENLSLKQQVMLNQFTSITGCTYEQSRQLLSSTEWQYQTALSLFFDDYSYIKNQNNYQSNGAANGGKTLNNNQLYASQTSATSINGAAPHVPCSTPVTPPNLDYLEKAFSKLSNAPSASLSSTANANSASNSSLNMSPLDGYRTSTQALTMTNTSLPQQASKNFASSSTMPIQMPTSSYFSTAGVSANTNNAAMSTLQPTHHLHPHQHHHLHHHHHIFQPSTSTSTLGSNNNFHFY